MSYSVFENNILNRINFAGSGNQLAIFRILLGLQIFYSSNSKLIDLLQVAGGTSETVTIFPSFLDTLIASTLVDYLQIIVPVLSVLLILGFLTRFVAPLLFISFLFLFDFWYINFDAPVPWLYIWFPLLIICFSKSSDNISLDALVFGKTLQTQNIQYNSYRWPIELVSAWFVYIYFSAGLAKIFPVTTLIEWMQGGTSQNILYERFLDSFLHYTFNEPFFDYSSNNYIFSILSILSIIVELSVIIILFTNRYNKIIIFLILSMHFFLFLTGVPGFMQLALILGICLINPKLFNDYPQTRNNKTKTAKIF
ncbi:hypothetical protein EAX61_11880 [Dokdonia sinensis]|uniref:HTTM domain-containing protein n=1 Tax=Dokdonia sinensis TaxID=2479847 RepID=A0A3M0G8R4_9FLAO|nr:hypothetical protein [Dokdonia sinensis]RMB57439.1 hypothetical protein EAX61_11880 [Dokdonia sinensis]